MYHGSIDGLNFFSLVCILFSEPKTQFSCSPYETPVSSFVCPLSATRTSFRLNRNSRGFSKKEPEETLCLYWYDVGYPVTNFHCPRVECPCFMIPSRVVLVVVYRVSLSLLSLRRMYTRSRKTHRRSLYGSLCVYGEGYRD